MRKKIVFRKNQIGFTLLEMLVVLAIFTILFGISLSEFKYFSSYHEENTIRLQFLQLIEFAHQEAMLIHQPVVLCKSKNHLRCGGEWLDGQLIFVNENADGIINNTKQILNVNRTNRAGMIHWRSFPFYRDYLLFNTNGLSDNSTFWFCSTHSSKPTWAILLSRMGKTRSIFPDKKGEIHDSSGALLKC